MPFFAAARVLFAIACALPLAVLAANPVCEARSGANLTPVIELYTSEGCSSCPPSDQWLSSLKGQAVVAEAFHVAYWDYIIFKELIFMQEPISLSPDRNSRADIFWE